MKGEDGKKKRKKKKKKKRKDDFNRGANDPNETDPGGTGRENQ